MKLPSRNAIVNELCRRDYHQYVAHVHGNMFKDGKHIQFLTKQVQDFLEDKFEGKDILLLSMPPQHGKSMSITETLPSWWLGKHQDDGVIVLSYGDDLAKKFGKKNKNKIIEYGKDIFGIELAKDQQSILNFGVQGKRGFGKFAGIMAGVTGNNADLIIIDDPIKNREQAESETYRAKLKQEFEDTVLSRLSAKGKVIVIQTRWHVDDLYGYIYKNFSEKCVKINIPLEAEENDIIGREIGDALFPEIGKDKEWLKEKKKMYITDSGIRSWTSLFQGHPTIQEGGIFPRKYANFIEKDKLPGIEYYNGKVVDYFAGMDYLIMTVDATFQGLDTSDRVSIMMLGKRGTDYYVCKVYAERLSFTQTLSAIRRTNSYFPNAQGKYIEKAANGYAILSMLKDEIEGMIGVDPIGSKISRAYAVQHIWESGHVYVVTEGPNDGTEMFMKEMSNFPFGEHDDMVDTFTLGINRLYKHHSEIKVPPKRDDFRDLIERERREERQDIVIDVSDFTF